MGFKPSNKGRQQEDAHMFDSAATTAPGRQHSYDHPTQSQATRGVDVDNPLPVSGTRCARTTSASDSPVLAWVVNRTNVNVCRRTPSAIELSPAPGCSLDIEDGRQHRDDAPSAPPLQVPDPPRQSPVAVSTCTWQPRHMSTPPYVLGEQLGCISQEQAYWGTSSWGLGAGVVARQGSPQPQNVTAIHGMLGLPSRRLSTLCISRVLLLLSNLCYSRTRNLLQPSTVTRT
jgi:hypothetical protein